MVWDFEAASSDLWAAMLARDCWRSSASWRRAALSASTRARMRTRSLRASSISFFRWRAYFVSAVFLVGSSLLVDWTGSGSVAGCFPFLFAEGDSFGWVGVVFGVAEDVAGVSLDDWGRVLAVAAVLECVSGTCDWKAGYNVESVLPFLEAISRN